MKKALLERASPELLLKRFGGLTVLERQLHLLTRAGIKAVSIDCPAPPGLSALRLPANLALSWNDSGGADIILPTQLIIRRKKLAALADAGFSGRLDLKTLGANAVSLEDGPLPIAWLLDEARKDGDSFMAKHFDRHVSLSLTRLLLDTSVTPTQMTLFSCAVGLAGAFMLSGGSYSWSLAGALTIWLHSLFDGCDGELARLRYQESRLGGQIDFWGDNLIHFVLFLSLGIGLWRRGGDETALWLGASAALGATASAFLVYRHTLKQEKNRGAGPLFRGVADVAEKDAGGVRRLLAKVEDTLTQRDFLYLLVALAWGDALMPFLWMSGIGSPLFAAVFLVLGRLRRT